MDYSQKIEDIRNFFTSQIERLLQRIGSEFVKRGWTWDDTVLDMTGDEYTWSIAVWPPGVAASDLTSPEFVDVSFTIVEQPAREGGGEGVALGLDAHQGGHPLVRAAPYNYTPQFWIDTNQARYWDHVLDRFAEVSGIDIPEFVSEVESQISTSSPAPPPPTRHRVIPQASAAPGAPHANCAYAGYCVAFYDLGTATSPCGAGRTP